MGKKRPEPTSVIYKWMDRLFDPPPKELRQARDQSGIVLYYETQDESYKRYKYLCYRNLILEALLAFILGLFAAAFFKV